MTADFAHVFEEREHGFCNQHQHRHSYALEKVTCPNVVLDKFDYVAESDYYDERGNYDADCRGDTAKNAATLYAYISCGVYRDWPRRAFGNGENIAQFVVSDPLLFLTSSASMSESMAYPPPKENKPILKNMPNSLSMSKRCCFLLFFSMRFRQKSITLACMFVKCAKTFAKR